MSRLPYKARIGSLLWLARNSRPDIAYQVNALARVAHNPGMSHWHATSMLIRYLSHTRDMGLLYERDTAVDHTPGLWKPVLWSDATWAPDYGDDAENFLATTGWVSMLGGNPVSWASHKQTLPAGSSTESEWYAAVDVAKEGVYLRRVLSDLGNPVYGPLELRCDNQSTVKQSVNGLDQRRSRHIGLRYHYLKHLCNERQIQLSYVPTAEQIGDIFTKCLPVPQHEYLRDKLRVRALEPPSGSDSVAL